MKDNFKIIVGLVLLFIFGTLESQTKPLIQGLFLEIRPLMEYNGNTNVKDSALSRLSPKGVYSYMANIYFTAFDLKPNQSILVQIGNRDNEGAFVNERLNVILSDGEKIIGLGADNKEKDVRATLNNGIASMHYMLKKEEWSTVENITIYVTDAEGKKLESSRFNIK